MTDPRTPTTEDDRMDAMRRRLLRGAAAGAGIAGLHLATGGRTAFAKRFDAPVLALGQLKNIDAGVLNVAYHDAAFGRVRGVRRRPAGAARRIGIAARGAGRLRLGRQGGQRGGRPLARAVRRAGLGQRLRVRGSRAASLPARPESEAPLWWQFYFQTERGRAGYAKYRREFNRLFWTQWSPSWRFDDATFARTAGSFDNPDHVDVAIHSFRHRFGAVRGDPAYAGIDRRLASLPAIPVRTVTLDGGDDGAHRPTDGSAQAAKFTGPRSHHVVAGAGHNLPQEAPRAFASAVLELVGAERGER